MKRFKDWDVKLMEYAESVKGKPFEWGATNCAALAAACVDAMTGTALYEFQAGLELDEEKARELSAERYTRTVLLREGMSDVNQGNKNLIQRGDVLLAMADGWECAHICLGRYALTSDPEHGVFMLPMSLLCAQENTLEVLRCP